MLLVMTTLPDQAAAEELATFLVESKVAACVSMLSPCTSVYRWQARVERAQEVPLLIKIPQEGYAALERALVARHPYEVPEIIALPVSHALPAYLAWVQGEVSAPQEGDIS